MARRERAHTGGQGALRGTLVLVLALVLVAGLVASGRYGWFDAWLGEDAQTPDPAAVAPPPGLDLPPVEAPARVAAAPSGRDRIDADAVRRTLAGYLDDPDLGRHVLAAVAPLSGGPPVYTRGRGGATPASLTKLVTATAALLALGPDHVFTTSVVATGGSGDTGGTGGTGGSSGSGRPTELVLVGGGDPFLQRTPRAPDGSKWPYPERADLQTLAERTVRQLRADGVRRVRLGYDDTLFTGPAGNRTWEPDYVRDEVVTPTNALWVDQGRSASGTGRVDDPSRAAAAAFAAALRDQGLRVQGTPAPAAAPSPAKPLATVDSAPLARIVQRTLAVSDNEASEVLLRHVGLSTAGEGSTAAGRQGVRRLLRKAGAPLGDSRFYDGSGLSRRNVADPSALIAVLRLASSEEHPELRPVLAGLPVAGFTGSLTSRMGRAPQAGLGRVRAKTGTLTNVTSLAGTATGLDGQTMVFVLMADRVRKQDALPARIAMDSAAGALGACRCGA